MKILLALSLAFTLAETALAEMVCSQEFNELVCRNSATGDEIRCRQVFGQQVCRNTKSGTETSCRQEFGKLVCR